MIVTADESYADLCRSLRAHGEKPKYYHRTVGYNSRLDTMQAAMLLVKLPHLQNWSEARIRHAHEYTHAFAGLEGLTTPTIKEYSTFHIFNQYTLLSPHRDRIVKGLAERKIGHCIYYPLAFDRQECFADLGYKAENFPVSNRLAREVFSIPIFPELTGDEQQEVIDAIKSLAAA